MLGSQEPAAAAVLPMASSAPSLMTDIACRSAVRVTSPAPPNGRRRRRHLISGSSLYWWNGGGDGSVHSSVVAPAPHGLSAALSPRMNACTTPKKKTSAPKPDTNDPSEETRFQSANASG